MGTQYTYDGTSTTSGATLAKPTLTGSTIAYYGYVDEDPYLRVLSCTGGGTLNDITVASGGSLYTSGGAKLSNLVISGNASDTYLLLNTNPTISGCTITGGCKIDGYGAKMYDVTISGAAGNRVALSNTNYQAVISRGTVVGATFTISRGILRDLVIGSDAYVNLYGSGYNSGGTLDEGGRVLSCTIQSGGQVRLWSKGHYVSSTTFNNAKLYMYGWTTADSQHYGKVNNVILENSAGFENGGISGTNNYSGGTATNITMRTSAYMYVRNGGYVSGAVVSGQSTRIIMSGGAIVKDVTLNGSGAYVHVSSGAVLNSVKIGSGCWINVTGAANATVSGGTATDVTVQSGGKLILGEASWQAQSKNPLASRVTIESGGIAQVANYARLMDVTAVSGAVISRYSNLMGIGGANTNIAKGVFNNAPGADFEVVSGVATGLELTGNGTTPQSCIWLFSGITATNAKVASGATLYLMGASTVGVDLYGSATKVGQLWVSNAGASDVRISSGGYLFMSTGATVQNVSMTSGGSIAMRGGTVSGLSMACSGGATVSGGTVSGLVLSGGTLWTASTTEK